MDFVYVFRSMCVWVDLWVKEDIFLLGQPVIDGITLGISEQFAIVIEDVTCATGKNLSSECIFRVYLEDSNEVS